MSRGHGLPQGWSLSPLHQIAEVVDPNPKHRNPAYVALGHPFISTAEFIEPDGITLETRRQVSEETVREQEARCQFDSRSIAFSRKGTIGKVRFLPVGVRFALLDSLCVINPDSRVNASYLKHALTSPLVSDQIQEETKGVALQQVSVGVVRELMIPVAPPNEQRRIVAKLNALFAHSRAAKASLERVPEMLDQLRQTTLATAFRGDWRRAKFGEVARVASDLVDPATHPDAPHIAPNHIESNWGRLLEYQTVTEDRVSSPKHRFKPGQILYSKIRPYLAKATLVNFAGLCSADMYPVETTLDATYLLFWMLSPEFTNLASQAQGRTVLPKINQASLSELPVPVPPPDEQQQIGRQIRSAFDRITLLRERANSALKLIDQLENAALATAFKGELVPQDPSDEPASVHLERIRAEHEAPGSGKGKRGKSRSAPAQARFKEIP